MDQPPSPTGPPENDRQQSWARPVDRVKVTGLPAGAVNLNVEGRQLIGALQGFGQMWQKTYRVRLSGAQVTPAQVIQTWRENFGSFWPQGNYFYSQLTRIEPGEVAVLNLQGPGNMLLSTGVMVIYADDESFMFMNPEGHMFAGWITFSADEKDGATCAQVQVLIRTNDPIWEVAMRLFGFQKEDAFWHATLQNLAAHFGVNGQVTQESVCLDPHLQWSQAKNVWHNAGVRSMFYTLGAPIRWVRGLFAH